MGSAIKVEPDDFLHVVSLPSSADITDDFTADSDEQASLDLVTSLLASIFKLFKYICSRFLVILIFFYSSFQTQIYCQLVDVQLYINKLAMH